MRVTHKTDLSRPPTLSQSALMHDALPDVVIASVVHDVVDFAGTWRNLKWFFEGALFREFNPSDVPILVKFPSEAEARCLARQKCFGALRDVVSPYWDS